MSVHAHDARGRRVLLAAATLATLAAAAAGCTSSGTPTSTSAAGAPTTTAPAASPSSVEVTTQAPATSAAPAGTAVPACSAAQLTIQTGVNQAASGHSYLTLIFTDSGTSACSLQGYPGAELTLPGGGKLDAERVGGGSASPVTIEPGKSASTFLAWEHFPQNGSADVSAADCAGYGATTLLVTAPNQTTSTHLAPPDSGSPVCWGFEVNPVVAGTSGR
ncbi:DUF4232 domain-containing protein [Actinospica durhamensis]|uniref:DUF4232 domain-containing protein n=1 Tax=Actinospica durhamensis TaxID=1508375 RepID=A0A941EKK2_9ACTN|nr:DUF4232 domain-containing protein [Actinospica durhamensis]MBR7832583.1 DUF4232 domain-containing protein [Actinospica durhamensis]